MISVVIATRDRAPYLERAFDSLERQVDAPPFEVIVVDNGSTDETREISRAAAGRMTLTYLHEAEPNRGAARNRGIARAGGEPPTAEPQVAATATTTAMPQVTAAPSASAVLLEDPAPSESSAAPPPAASFP